MMGMGWPGRATPCPICGEATWHFCVPSLNQGEVEEVRRVIQRAVETGGSDRYYAAARAAIEAMRKAAPVDERVVSAVTMKRLHRVALSDGLPGNNRNLMLSPKDAQAILAALAAGDGQ